MSPCHANPLPRYAFSPHGGANALVVGAIREARHTIRIAAYSFTSKTHYGSAGRRCTQRRRCLSGALERYSAAPVLRVAGLPIRFDHRYSIMHDKFVVVDGETVETGGFNFSSSAESRKAENVLVLHDVP